jgi:lipoprotein-anchoring transpeptidase ErfK/SrfK
VKRVLRRLARTLGTLPAMGARRPLLLLLATATASLGAVPAASAQAPRPGERIAPGMTAGGLDVAGLTVPEAAGKLERAFGRKLGRDVVVKAAGRRTFRLSARTAKLRFDTERTAKRALYRGREVARQPPPPSGGGQPVATDVPLAISHARKPVAAFSAQVARSVGRAPRNATMRITVRRIYVRGARHGLRLDHRALARSIDAALADTSASRVFRPKRARVRAAINANDLRRRSGTVITVDRANFKLRLFKQLRFSRSYRVAVGMAGRGTPPGRYAIQSKQVNPAWHVPRSSWAGSLAGKTIPPGAPNNPLKARWLGVNGSVGIHGTAEEWSIGSRASKGCIRMRVSDVKDLFRRVSVGTPVLIR